MYAYINSYIEQITVQKIPKKLLSKCPPECVFFSPDAYAVPGVRGSLLPLLHSSASPGGCSGTGVHRKREKRQYLGWHFPAGASLFGVDVDLYSG